MKKILLFILMFFVVFNFNYFDLQKALAASNKTKSTLSKKNQKSPKIKWGAYAGESIKGSSKLEKLVGKKMDMQAVFVGWGDEIGKFPSEYSKTVRDKNKKLIIFWEPGDGSSSLDQPDYNYDSILSGRWDEYIQNFALDAKNYSGPIILIPFAEMNGNWDIWCGTVNGNSPSKFIDAWIYLRSFFSDNKNVKFAWDVDRKSLPDIPENSIESYYPGNAYVDYVGIDGFNYGNPWLSFEKLFVPAIKKLRPYHKPIYIFSMASASGKRKAAWIKNALRVQIPNYKIAGWVWFNKNKERNWRINSDHASLSAFKKAIQKTTKK